MTLTKRRPQNVVRTRSLLSSLIELPNLSQAIEALPAPTFAALVRKVGIEDAGEIVAFATTDQLVQAFDEDLFVSDRAGERESLDVGRFVVWLEVLLEAGDAITADRIAELDEDFVAHALDGVLLVLEEEALRERLDEGDEDEARRVDKALESALTEEIDGYILVAKQHDGWDAVLALVLALDRDHRALLVRLLDRLARAGHGHLEELDELSTVLSEGESLAEDAESAREERLRAQGFVEARTARAFLSLARKPVEDGAPVERDPLTHAYFRDVERGHSQAISGSKPVAPAHALPPAILRELDDQGSGDALASLPGGRSRASFVDVFTEALRDLSREDPARFGERMEEFAYLTNVLIAGHDRDGARLRPKEAADAVICTVCYGAVIELRAARSKADGQDLPTPGEVGELLRGRRADVLFRIASAALAQRRTPRGKAPRSESVAGLLYTPTDLEAVLAQGPG